MRYQGKLFGWNDEKGFGFVEPDDGGERCFVHIKSFQKRSRRPAAGDLIVYEKAKDIKGKYKAVNVSLVGNVKAQVHTNTKRSKTGLLIFIGFCAALALSVLSDSLPIEIAWLFIAVSVITFVVYAFDKAAAKSKSWRTPEIHLHLLSLAGGWPGAYLAQNILRHKSSKKTFKQEYWATVVINLCAFVWLFSAQGQMVIKMFLELIISLRAVINVDMGMF